MAKSPREREEEAERARRDLARMHEQSEKLLGPEQHDGFGGQEEDFAEVWGKRIGRGLGVAFALFLIVYLLGKYVLK
ncbi:MAG: hypothetical protein HKN05_01580 [Rhizobiales bacterium]|nr:hypothetical protein [Hyphomicrobiales bacterium]